jgi:hypothetical protein
MDIFTPPMFSTGIWRFNTSEHTEELFNPYILLLCVYIRDIQFGSNNGMELMNILYPLENISVEPCIFGDFVFAKAWNVREVIEWIGNVNQNAVEMWTLLNEAHKTTGEDYSKPLIFTLFIGNLMNIVIDCSQVHPITKWIAKACHEWTRVTYNTTGHIWDTLTESYMFFDDKFFSRSPIFQSQQLVLIGNAWKPVSISLKTHDNIGFDLAKSESCTTIASVTDIYNYAQYAGIRNLPCRRGYILADVSEFIKDLVDSHIFNTVDDYLVIPYELTAIKCDPNHAPEKLRLLLLCPGVDACPIIIDFTSFRLIINDILFNYNAANVIMILRRIFTHVNSLAWLVPYITPCIHCAFDLVSVEPFDNPDYDICRLPPIPNPDEETYRVRTATYKIFTV